MIQLETYNGTKSRHTCPACNSKGVFVRYKDERGEYLSNDVGRCNRESKCGYHYKPKQYFADNPTDSNFQPTSAKKRNVSIMRTQQNITAESTLKQTASFDYIAPEHLKVTLGNYDRNAFVQFLLNLFPDCVEEIQDVLKMYFVGTFDDYTCFPQIDRQMRVCKAKLIRFNPVTGKRLKGEYAISSLVKKLKLKEDFTYKQIFFGEHLLPRFPDKPIIIVESEKSAIIGSLCFPEYVWLGSNSKTWLNPERIKQLGGRKIILYPDADGFETWRGIAQNAQKQGLNVKVSNLIENRATDEQKANGYDLADYLIGEQNEINEINEFIDRYNAKLDMVLSDEKLNFDTECYLPETDALIGKL